jgi:secondary thiamine-phosphate synthase enzyme
MVSTSRINLQTRGRSEVIDITPEVRNVVEKTGITSGIVVPFVVGSTAALTTVENESGLILDFKDLWEKLIPSAESYRHYDNAHSHLRSSLLGASLAIPLVEGRMVLGTWQQIVLVDFDTRPRSRQVVVQVIGE